MVAHLVHQEDLLAIDVDLEIAARLHRFQGENGSAAAKGLRRGRAQIPEPARGQGERRSKRGAGEEREEATESHSRGSIPAEALDH